MTDNLETEEVELKGLFSNDLRADTKGKLVLFRLESRVKEIEKEVKDLVWVEYLHPKMHVMTPQPWGLGGFPQQRPSLLPWVTQNSLAFYDPKTMEMGASIQLNPSLPYQCTNSTWILLDDSSVLIHAGGTLDQGSPTVHRLSQDGTVTQLPDMTYSRTCCSLGKWRGDVLALGSYGPNSSKCELFSVGNSLWAEVADLHIPRFGCTPIEWTCEVYIAGGNETNTIEVFNGHTMRLLSIHLPESGLCLAVIRRKELVLLTSNYLSGITLQEGSGALSLRHRSHPPFDTSPPTPPLLYGHLIFTLVSPGRIAKYSVDDGYMT